LQREEAALTARYRNSEIDPSLTLQNSVYEIESQNRRLKKELRTLDLQLKRTSAELAKERAIEVADMDDSDYDALRGRKLREQLQELNEQIQKGSDLKNQIEGECEGLKREIDGMMEELVSLGKKSVKSVRKSGSRGRR
jgi:chromosome segregation ATPase